MEITKQTIRNNFKKAVIKHFTKIASDFNLKLQQNDPDTFFMLSDKCKVVIFLYWGKNGSSFNITIRPVAGEKKSEEEIEEYWLELIARTSNPDYKNIPSNFTKPDELDHIAEQFSSVLVKYGSEVMQGDFSIWPKINQHINSKKMELEKKIQARKKKGFGFDL